MAGLVNLKGFFRQREKPKTYKHRHYLNQLPEHKLEEILLFSEGDHLGALLPLFEGKKILFFDDQKHKYVFNKTLAQEPAYLVNYVYSGADVTEQRGDCLTVMGDLISPALRKGHFDVVICPLVLEKPATVEAFLRKAAGCLDNGSRLLLSVRHPQLENILFNQNPGSTQVAESLVSRYYGLLKENGLFTEEVREGCVDLALKPFFTDSEHDYYHEYKNTPLTLLLRTVKFVRKTQPA